MNNPRIDYLFQQLFNNSLTPVEKDELMEWLSEPGNEEQAKSILEDRWLSFANESQVFSPDDSRKILGNIFAQSTPVKVVSPVRMLNIWKRVAVAAAIIAIAGATIFLFNRNRNEVNQLAAASAVKKQEIIPGGTRAYLTLADGSTILLDSARNGMISLQGQAEVKKINGSIVYDPTKKSGSETMLYNTVSTPKGGEYRIVLSDGTIVWLNAASSLTYPANFLGKERKVSLTGEAYFDVAKNAAMPFKVSTGNGMEVEVLGTGFNVMAYEDENEIRTTLIEGSVKVTGSQKTMRLLPSQQAVLDKSNSVLSVGEADVEEAVAWKEGNFYFNDENILSIMRKLARWYNVDVTYTGPVPKGHYAGSIKRKSQISEVLNLLELPGGIEFKIEGNQINVRSK